MICENCGSEAGDFPKKYKDEMSFAINSYNRYFNESFTGKRICIDCMMSFIETTRSIIALREGICAGINISENLLNYHGLMTDKIKALFASATSISRRKFLYTVYSKDYVEDLYSEINRIIRLKNITKLETIVGDQNE